jgi:hypothetical protein
MLLLGQRKRQNLCRLLIVVQSGVLSNSFTLLPFPANLLPVHSFSFLVQPSRLQLYSSCDDKINGLGLDDHFNRWRWLQRLLDEETDPDETNRILYRVIDGYLRFPSEDAEGSPDLTTPRKTNLENIIQNARAGKIEAIMSDATASSNIMEQLERLLPDPTDDEDASNSLWDTVIEIAGRESVKQNEQSGRMEWTIRCMVARVLIFYDFLIRGLVE